MMKHIPTFLISFFSVGSLFAQDFTSYFTGSTTDVNTNPQGGICMMGGATEDDSAMVWFLERADGGDVVVLRTSGSDGYNNYMYQDLGVQLNSVETIVFNAASAAQDPAVVAAIAKAEAIWFAGGDQWEYLSYWRNTPVDSTINAIIKNKNCVIGGTSAGMAILGGIQYSAENGSVLSSEALSNPYDSYVTLETTPFIDLPVLSQVITDTHYDNPDRKGRHVAFMARMLTDEGILPYGIACDEYTAVCIDEQGLARVFGGYPDYDDYAYFIQYNCALNNPEPETCSNGAPLTWNHNQQALIAYKVAGTPTGDGSFNLNDWKTATSGNWEYWWAENGVLSNSVGAEPECEAASLGAEIPHEKAQVHPNPAKDVVYFPQFNSYEQLLIYTVSGQSVAVHCSNEGHYLDVSAWDPGLYLFRFVDGEGSPTHTERVLIH